MKTVAVVLTLVWLALAALPTLADEADAAAPGQEPRVLAAQGSGGEPHKAGIGERITLTLRGRDLLLEQARTNGRPLVAYLDGMPLRGVRVQPAGKDRLEIDLRRSGESADTWARLVEQRSSLLSTEVSLSVGLEDGIPLATEVNRFEVVLVKKGWLVACLLAVAGLWALFLWLARRSNILRDTGPPPATGERPFSISRTQMAFWFFLVILCYPFIWLITGELGSITGSVLGLMGISAGTALSATAIDASKRSAGANERITLSAQREALGARLRELTQQLPQANEAARPALQGEMDAKRVRYREIDERLKHLPPEQHRASKGFLFDLVCDHQGVSFHRFQILAWTLVLGIIFVAEVFTNLKMPEFSETLLALMGVSSGTYIGFKFPEQQSK
jgi:hypothetical protein